MTTKEILEKALSLPVEERAFLADSLLGSLNKPNRAIDAKWTEVAKRRLEELRSEAVQPIPGEVVFERVMKRFSK